MVAGAEIFNVLTADTNLTAIISTRVYPSSLPSGNKLPCVIYRAVDAPPQDVSQEDGGSLFKIRWQMDCWSERHSEAESLAGLVRKALKNGGLGAEIINSFDATSEADIESENMWHYIVEASTWHGED